MPPHPPPLRADAVPDHVAADGSTHTRIITAPAGAEAASPPKAFRFTLLGAVAVTREPRDIRRR
ncbi:hypothetical protein GCM10023336_77440 [Streptomyces similanensis]|uniref:Uncharacterized protein n=1 Tax=Streptomyces similanensis TaxID=1274988 RepID=A0ABP9LS08_9ACTN